jgi:hypothetical protein
MIVSAHATLETNFPQINLKMSTSKSASYDYLIKLLLIGDSGKTA